MTVTPPPSPPPGPQIVFQPTEISAARITLIATLVAAVVAALTALGAAAIQTSSSAEQSELDFRREQQIEAYAELIFASNTMTSSGRSYLDVVLDARRNLGVLPTVDLQVSVREAFNDLDQQFLNFQNARARVDLLAPPNTRDCLLEIGNLQTRLIGNAADYSELLDDAFASIELGDQPDHAFDSSGEQEILDEILDAINNMPGYLNNFVLSAHDDLGTPD